MLSNLSRLFQSRARAYPSSDELLHHILFGDQLLFQSRARAYPSSDVEKEQVEVVTTTSFNPALGLIHLLSSPTPVPLFLPITFIPPFGLFLLLTGDQFQLYIVSHLAFNPALGLIHFLTFQTLAVGVVALHFQSRARAYPSSDIGGKC